MRLSSAAFAAALSEAEAIASHVAAAAAGAALDAGTAGGEGAGAAAATAAAAYDPMELTQGRTRHLWLGNLNSRASRGVLRQVGFVQGY